MSEKRRNRISLAIITAHATLAMMWWWIMPHGFRFAHSRFWLNEVLPLVVLAASVATFRWRSLVTFIPWMWLIGGVMGIVVFPHDFRIAATIMLIAAIAMSRLLAPMRSAPAIV